MKKQHSSAHRLIPVAEVALALGVTDVTIRRMVRDGRIPAIRVGGKIVVRSEVIERIQREGVPARSRTDRQVARKEA